MQEGWYAPVKGGLHATHAHFFRKDPDQFRPNFYRAICRAWSIDRGSSRWQPLEEANRAVQKCRTCSGPAKPHKIEYSALGPVIDGNPYILSDLKPIIRKGIVLRYVLTLVPFDK